MLFDQYIEPRCGYCRHGGDIGDGDIICVKRGVVDADDACLRFSYEPTKRVPEKVSARKPETAAEFDLSITEKI
jgi:hypothetical protein